MTVEPGDLIYLTNAVKPAAHTIVGVSPAGRARTACGVEFATWRGSKPTHANIRGCQSCERTKPGVSA